MSENAIPLSVAGHELAQRLTIIPSQGSPIDHVPAQIILPGDEKGIAFSVEPFPDERTGQPGRISSLVHFIGKSAGNEVIIGSFNATRTPVEKTLRYSRIELPDDNTPLSA